MKLLITLSILVITALFALGCDKQEQDADSQAGQSTSSTQSGKTEGDHVHDEVPLGRFEIGGVAIQAAQGHGAVEAGKESHLVIKLPYNDRGATTVRAWIGTADRTLSTVGKGEYAPSHDDYDIHALAPAPLPADAQWWVEIEKPDGSKAVGSFPFADQK